MVPFPPSMLHACHGQTIQISNGKACKVLLSDQSFKLMHQSIPPVPIPPGNPRAFVHDRFSVREVGPLCTPWQVPPPPHPRILIHMVSKPSKSQAIKLRVLFLCNGGFRGKSLTVACLQRTRQAC